MFLEDVVDYLWGMYFDIVMVVLDFVYVLFEYLVDVLVIWVLEYYVWCFFLQVEQVELFVDVVMVVFFGFFDVLDVGCQLFFVGLGGVVDVL